MHTYILVHTYIYIPTYHCIKQRISIDGLSEDRSQNIKFDCTYNNVKKVDLSNCI